MRKFPLFFSLFLSPLFGNQRVRERKQKESINVLTCLHLKRERETEKRSTASREVRSARLFRRGILNNSGMRALILSVRILRTN